MVQKTKMIQKTKSYVKQLWYSIICQTPQIHILLTLENPTNLHSEQEKYTTAPNRTVNSMRQQLPANQTTYFYHFQTNYFAPWITKYETKLGTNKKAP